jgi:hypothetical protein
LISTFNGAGPIVAIFTIPFFFNSGVGRRLILAEVGNRDAFAIILVSEEGFLAGEVCEMPVLLWNKSTQQKTIITDIQPGRIWFAIHLCIFILRFSQK